MEPEPEDEDLEWNRKRRAVAEEEEEDGWKCDMEEKEEAVEQESTDSSELGCRRRARRLGPLPSDLRGQAAVNAGPLSVRECNDMPG